jgi:hypothetical protein
MIPLAESSRKCEPEVDPQESPELARLRKRVAAAVAAMETAAQIIGKQANEVLNSIDRALGDRLAEAVAASKATNGGVNGVSITNEPLIRSTGLFRIDLADVLAGRVAFAHAVEGVLGQLALCRRVDVVMPDGTIMHVGRARSGLKVTFEAGPKSEAKPKDIAGREYRWPLVFDAEPGAHPWPFKVTGVQTEFQCDAGAQSTKGPPAMTRLSLSRRRDGCNESATLVMRGRELARSMRVGDEFHIELRPAEKTGADDAPKPVKDPCVRWPSLWGTGP